MTPRVGRIRLGVLLLALAFSAAPAAAHIPQLRGRLTELVSQSDLVIIGTVAQTRAVDVRHNDTTVRVEGRLIGDVQDPVITFRAAPYFAPGKRFVFFLHREGGGLECVQPSGTLFGARPADDPTYRETVTAVRRALPRPDAERTAALRAAMIPALSAAAPPLRYHAVLELAELSPQGLSPAERRSLEHLLADPATDPAIRPIVSRVLARGR